MSAWWILGIGKPTRIRWWTASRLSVDTRGPHVCLHRGGAVCTIWGHDARRLSQRGNGPPGSGSYVQYRCLFARIWLHCYSSPLEMDDNVCLFRYQLLPDIDVWDLSSAIAWVFPRPQNHVCQLAEAAQFLESGWRRGYVHEGGKSER